MKNSSLFSMHAEDSSGLLLWQVTTLWQQGINKTLDAFGLTHAQFVLLANLQWLSEQQAQVMQIDLSNHSKIDPMSTSTIVRNLEKRGLLYRKAHEIDTRAKGVSMSDAGAELMEAAIAAVEGFDRQFFAPLGNEGSKFNLLLGSLVKEWSLHGRGSA